MQRLFSLFQSLLSTLLTLVGVLAITFLLIRLLPGEPFLDPKIPESVRELLKAKYHLNEPLWVQFGYYLQGLCRGDLGPSMVMENRSVKDLLWEGLGYSACVGFPALVLGLLGGVGLGALRGFYPAHPLGKGLDGFATLLLATPSFTLAGSLLLIFSMGLGWFPAIAFEVTPQDYALPILALSAYPFAFAFFFTRSSIEEWGHSLFIHHKQSLGIAAHRIRWVHWLRVALLPVIALIGPMAANLLTGSFVIENVFAIPGLGKHFVSSVVNRDYTVILGLTLLYATLLIGLNGLMEKVLRWLDPRLRHG
jgi:oligopeptide transport system permease protein